MNKIKMTTLGLLAVLITACGAQATPQAPLQPAPATEAVVVQPTQTLAPTETPLPEPTATEMTAPTAEPVPTESAPTEVSFANDVMPIFEASCVKCHGVESVKEGLDLRTYEGLMAGSFNGAVLTPGNADESFLVQQLIEGEMPKRSSKLSDQKIKLIADWVNAGAENN